MATARTNDATSVITCDMEGLVTTYSEGAEELFGWTAREVVGKARVTLFHRPEALETLVPRLLQTAAQEGKFEEVVTLVRKDGGQFQGLLTVRPIYRDGSMVGYMGHTVPVEG